MNTAATESNLKSYLRVALILLSISAAIALILAAINMVTADIIAANEQKATEDAIAEVFPNAADFSELDGNYTLPVTAVWKVANSDGSSGYCVFATVQGFKAEVSYIVGTDEAGVIQGVRVISNSETAGLGARIAEVSYLEKYIGKSGKLTLKDDIDAISGATISSRALLDGINRALELPIFGTPSETSEVTAQEGDETQNEQSR